jgi:hypothetical protein
MKYFLPNFFKKRLTMVKNLKKLEVWGGEKVTFIRVYISGVFWKITFT